MLRLATFVALSAVLVVISRASLRSPSAHGFWRLLAWECIVALFVLNFISARQWFGDSTSARQLVSWFLLFGSIVPAVAGAVALRRRGRPDERRDDDPALLGIERTTRLVTTGAYRRIRHPMYSSLLLLAWGVFFKHPSWIGAALALTASACLLATAKIEEQENLRYFGAAYRAYMKDTTRFLPFVF